MHNKPDDERDFPPFVVTCIGLLCMVGAAITLPMPPNPARSQAYEELTVNLQALSTTPQTAKANPGTFLRLECFNPNAAATWVQFFDTAAAITLGTTVATKTYQIPPASSSGPINADPQRFAWPVTNSMRFAATTTQTGATPPTTGIACDVTYR